MQPQISFSAGPAILPAQVVAQLAEYLSYWPGAGCGAVGMSHRHPAFIDAMAEIELLVRALLDVPDDYHVLWAPGGATQQFAVLPMNLLQDGQAMGFVDTGYWGRRAYGESVKVVDASLVVPEAITDHQFTLWHTVLNETIAGIVPKVVLPGGAVADATSHLFSMPVTVNDFAALYASCQKNLGIPGACLVIVKADALVEKNLPVLWSYPQLAKRNSVANTVPVITMLSILLMLRWMRKQGGVEVLAAQTQQRAQGLYQAVDGSALFNNEVSQSRRSPVNIVFSSGDAKVDQQFISFAEQCGLLGLAGHCSVGGLRASNYVAMTDEGVGRLIQVMQDFERK